MTDQADRTEQTNTEAMTLDLLMEIRDKLANIEERQAAIERQVEGLSIDVHTVHDFQKVFAERLSIVERFCVEQPLATPAPYKVRHGG